jgi:hypothetical protein
MFFLNIFFKYFRTFYRFYSSEKEIIFKNARKNYPCCCVSQARRSDFPPVPGDEIGLSSSINVPDIPLTTTRLGYISRG